MSAEKWRATEIHVSQNQKKYRLLNIIHLHVMTGPEGNVSETKLRETSRLEGKQNYLFPEGPVISVLHSNQQD